MSSTVLGRGICNFGTLAAWQQALSGPFSANQLDADQDQTGRRLISHVEKVRKLLADKEIRALDQGEGRPFDVEEFLREKNERYGRRVVGGP